MSGIAKKAGLNRESLYKALGETGNPEFRTVMRIVRALGLTLSARPAANGQTTAQGGLNGDRTTRSQNKAQRKDRRG
jgi:hypothetical protein